MKYLVRWKRFIVKNSTWKKEKDLENLKETVVKFEGRMSVEVRIQEKLDLKEEWDYRRGELLGKYIAKMLHRWDDGKFEEEYLRKLKKN